MIVTMKTIIILPIIFYISVNALKENCNGTIYNNICHDIEVLREGIRKPFSLALVHTTSNLYFSYNRRGRTETARLNLNTHRFDTIENIPDAKTNTVDRRTGDVYIGACPGIYKLRGHQHEQKPQLHTANESCIQSLFFHNFRLYYITYPSLNVYVNGINRRDKMFKELVDISALNFVIDKYNVMYYNNDSGLFFQKFGTNSKKAILIPSDHLNIKCLTVDNKGDIFVCMEDGIYKFFRKSYDLGKVLDVEQPLGLTFDIYNNIIYANESVIAKLKPRIDISDTVTGNNKVNNKVRYASVKPVYLEEGQKKYTQVSDNSQATDIPETTIFTDEINTEQTEVTPTRDPFQIHSYWYEIDKITTAKYETKSKTETKKHNRFWAEMLEPVTVKDLDHLKEHSDSFEHIEDHGKHRHWVAIKETNEYESTTDYETKSDAWIFKEKNRYWARLLEAKDGVTNLDDISDKSKILKEELPLNKPQYAKDNGKDNNINDLIDYESISENPDIPDGGDANFGDHENKDDNGYLGSEFDPIFKKYETITDETIADIAPIELLEIGH